MEARIEIYRLKDGKWNWALREPGNDITKQGQGYSTRSNAISGAKQFNGEKAIYLPNGDNHQIKQGRYPIVLMRNSGQDVGEIYSPRSSNGTSFSVRIEAANTDSEARG